MEKISTHVSNDFCPQTMFLYGTYLPDGTPNFGLFCWVSYCWDGELSVMACIGEKKLTQDRIRETGVFSANLVTADMIPLADRLGGTSGYNSAKREIAVNTSPGKVLNVPVLEESPWAYELEVARTLPLEGEGAVYICRIRNVLADPALLDDSVSITDRITRINPACTTTQTYFSFTGERLGAWNDFAKRADFTTD